MDSSLFALEKPEMTYIVFSGTLNPTHFTSLHWKNRLFT